MFQYRRWLSARRLAGLAAIGLLSAGCVGERNFVRGPATLPDLAALKPATQPPGDAAIVQAEYRAAALPEGPLTVDALIQLALANNPNLAIAQAKAEAARGKLVQAGLYPNPSVVVDAQQMGLKERDGQPGFGAAQEFVTGNKLGLAQAAAAFGVDAADWQALTQWYELVIRVRSAYYEVLTAEQELATLEEIVRIFQQGLDANERLAKAGIAGQPDVIRARVELTQTRNRLQIAQHRRATAWKLLATAVGVAELPPRPIAGDLKAPAPPYEEWEPLVAEVILRSSWVQEAQANVLQAQRELRLAQVQVIPNIELGLQPAYDIAEENPILTVSAGAKLPIFNRNQGNILAAQAEVSRSLRATQQVQLELTERLAAAVQRYQNALATIAVYEKQVIPDAIESLRLNRLGFDTGQPKFDFNAVLDAQRTLAQARLSYLQAQGELWQAVSIIEGLLQREPAPLPIPGLHPGICP